MITIKQIIIHRLFKFYLQFIINQLQFMKMLSLLFALFIIPIAHSQSYQGVFAFSWIAGYCYNEQIQHKQLCSPSQIDLWDHQSFTIHGLWPQLNSTQKYGNFNLNLFQREFKLIDDMSNFWPPKTKPSHSTVFLWQHEWETHGQDYSSILYKLRPSDFPEDAEERNAALQVAYFKDALNLYKKIPVIRMPSGTYSSSEFANWIGLAQNQFIFVCAKGNLLRELQVCFEISKSGNMISACKKSTNTCTKGGETIQLMNWESRRQQRVFNYP